LSAADEVEIYSTVDRAWLDGYEVCDLASIDGHVAFRVRRQRDGVELPDALPATRIRPAHSAARLPPDVGER
jgi:hypothetical protein